ncbi:MAG: glutamine-hydrolyzing carbamoyl-phosphate synthase small subunit [Coleofasciculaceae cyanobacterium RL_1_1]|nr:glutamine-hydrolyzing carbamoyl-phosphate synthase small subunit [Coleofasciculaceae cyanobacterium RL_1_1]
MPITGDRRAILVLADGTTFEGWSFGAEGTTIGEVVFNTGMTGYQEVLTDPSYCGQLVTFTYPELGNVGVNDDDEEASRPFVIGAIARNISCRPSNWRSTQSLTDYLIKYGIPGIYGIDTRALTRKLRSVGSMNGGISTEMNADELLAQVQSAPSMAGQNLAAQVSTPETYEWTEATADEWEFSPSAKAATSAKYTIVALDFGVKRNILRRLASYGCRVIVVPLSTSPEDILKHNPDGIFLSNGPGDPAAVTEGVATVRALLDAGKPMFGICMGHQILGQAIGAETFKLKFGHRGLNQPCGMEQKQVEITSQNHGFAIDADSLDAQIEVTHLNLNDRTVAGLRHKTLPVFSVQYHPEASPGPHDADYLFEEFVKAIEAAKVA